MKILGIDSSSNATGWGVIERNGQDFLHTRGVVSLIEFGLITPHSPMSVTQRLYFFGNEIEKMINKVKPDEIAIEETILVRGPKIMRTLARFSGVALYKAYSYQKREIAAFEPQVWKKKLGISGHAKKAEVQCEICKIFNLIDETKLNEYKKLLEESGIKIKEIKDIMRKKSKEFDGELKKLKRQSKADKASYENLTGLFNAISEKKMIYIKEMEKQLRVYEKVYEQVGTNIYSDVGLNNDVADALGVALCVNK